MIFFRVFLLLVLFQGFLFGQNSKDFATPLSGLLIPVNSFGALKYLHIHSGLDLSTGRKKGVEIYAADAGEVNRIKISPYGLGTTLYIKHASGFTTVYGHLSAFAEPLASYVKEQQYTQELYEIELFPLLGDFPIKKGQLIGFSGDTGNAYTPKLHFEVRETSSDSLFNPLLFGIEVGKDTKPPIINQLCVYPKNDSIQVNGLLQSSLLSFKRIDSQHVLADIVEASGAVGFGISGYDKSESYYGKNAIYKMALFVNDSLYSTFVLDTFTFQQSSKISHIIDYKKWINSHVLVYKLFNTNHWDLPFLTTYKNDGFVPLSRNKSQKVTIRVEDFEGNFQEIIIPVIYKENEMKTSKEKPKGRYIDYYRDYIFEENNKYVEWRAETFFEDNNIEINLSEEQVSIMPTSLAIQKPLDIRFDVSELSIDKERTFIARIEGNKVFYNPTWKRGDDFRIRTRKLGIFELRVDTIAPKVKNLTEPMLYSKDLIVLEIEDKESGIKSYKGTINGKWALFVYDYQKKTLTHTLTDGIAKKGMNNLLVEIKDNLGNNTIFDWNFELK